ncbi:histidine kinase [Vibrio sp. HA2012]|uniref:alpha/beta fold hydrolase n=1 Tax=Vibrio sp. HA2012 TaxID=1971595 RepID=UPI000C2B6824|nr:alpha/beta fold hydrolase [Vibrio sp. HA2012]PJC85477.1 histidine kinase [Vibrio sp. HA2012]
MSALLNYKQNGTGHTILLIHGLFGNMDNLGLLERELVSDYRVISLDLRNHGHSFHSDQHNYQLMAEDVVTLIHTLALEDVTLIGHSMGGKVAMKVSDLIPETIRCQVIMDMAPVAYKKRKHDAVFAGLNAVSAASPSSRAEAMAILAEHINLDGVRQFLGKSLYRHQNHLNRHQNHLNPQQNHFIWRFNVPSLEKNYLSILDWETIALCHVPTLFLKGADSDYLLAEYQDAVTAQFAHAKAHVIANTGHWLHAEKPAQVTRVIKRFLNQQNR